MDLVEKKTASSVRVVHLPDSDFTIVFGRAVDADIVIKDSSVSRRHAVLILEDGIYYICDEGSRAGTFLEGERIDGKTPIGIDMSFTVGSHTYYLADTVADCAGVSSSVAGDSKTKVNSSPPSSNNDVPPVVKKPTAEDFQREFKDAALISEPSIMDLKQRLHANILEKMNLSEDTIDLTSVNALLPKLEECLNQTLKEKRHELPSDISYDVFRQALLDELIGFGPITPMIRSKNVSEIMVNGPDFIFVESNGLLFETGVRFFNDKHLLQIIRRIVEPLGRHVDDASPMVDGRLPDGSRVNAIIPPLSLNGSSLTIRKFSEKKLSAQDLVCFGSMTQEMADFLECAVKSRQNIIVSGGTGSGKTTLLNVLSLFIPSGERVVTVEDSAELKLSHRNIVRLEARPANIEGKGKVAIRDLVVNCLRMRPDRIIVGECRGQEALDMLQAMNTGHDGSLTTLHANTPRDALTRMENMVMMAGFDLPSSAIREQIASAVNLIVQQTRLPDGSRKIVNITEVTGREQNIITMQDIFVFKKTGIGEDGNVEGYHTATGNIPYFVEALREAGNSDLDMNVFVPRT